jgi:hypothetical protein
MSTYRIKKRRRSHVGPILLIAAGLLLILLMIWQLSIKAAAMPSALAPAVSTEVIRVELEEARWQWNAVKLFLSMYVMQNFSPTSISMVHSTSPSLHSETTFLN